MGVQIPRCSHSEVSKKDVVLRVAAIPWRGVPKADRAEREPDRGRHLMPDHVHMMISSPPKCNVSQVIGFIKGRSAIHLARVHGENRRNFVGQSFLGARIFRIDCRSRRRGHPELHPEPGAGGRALGANEPLAQTATSVADRIRGRVSAPDSRFERLTTPEAASAIPGRFERPKS